MFKPLASITVGPTLFMNIGLTTKMSNIRTVYSSQNPIRHQDIDLLSFWPEIFYLAETCFYTAHPTLNPAHQSLIHSKEHP